ncbi:hypothetical protein K9M74_04430 [Candidatus Woesearchaeota archaeon]|nr:hypothetical protein [Candidatus Woesearchaeota archaeon]
MGACVLCEEQITTPLGPERLGEQIEAWINETDSNMLKSFRKASDELLDVNRFTDDICIVNKTPMHVCAYCYTEHIFKWLLTTKPSWEQVRSFLLHFDYDTSKYGYAVRPEAKIDA